MCQLIIRWAKGNCDLTSSMAVLQRRVEGQTVWYWLTEVFSPQMMAWYTYLGRKVFICGSKLHLNSWRSCCKWWENLQYAISVYASILKNRLVLIWHFSAHTLVCSANWRQFNSSLSLWSTLVYFQGQIKDNSWAVECITVTQVRTW